MVSRGDQLLDSPLAKIGKGLFVKELQTALMSKTADIAALHERRPWTSRV